MAEHEIVAWHHELNGHEFEQTPRDGKTEEPDVLQSMWWHMVRHNLGAQQQIILKLCESTKTHRIV